MIQPSLQIGGGDWAVKETKLLGTNPLLNEKLPVEIDVTNATIGSRVNKEGFIENGVKNLLPWSEDFSNEVWLTLSNLNAFGGGSIVNDVVSPDGSQTADYIQENTANNVHRVQFGQSKLATTTPYTFSVFAKKKERNKIRIQMDDGTSNGTACVFDLILGSFETPLGFGTPFSSITASIEIVNNDFYRCTLSATSNASTTIRAQIHLHNETINVYSGDGVSGLYIWGAQLEIGSVATEYYPTTTRTNLARIDYSSGEALLLIEPQRTNLVTYNNDPSQTTWANSGATLNGETTIAPDGSIVKGYDLTGYLQDIYGGTSGLNYVNSIWVKANQTGLIGLRSPASSNVNLEITTSWRRISVSALSSDTNGKILLDNRTTALPNLKLFVWGAQAEQGTFITSTIPTLASAVTRNADFISKSGINDLDISGNTETFLFGDVVFRDDNNLNGFDLYTDNLNKLTIRRNIVSVGVGGTGYALYSFAFIPNIRYKILVKYKNNDSVVFVNGIKGTVITSIPYVKHKILTLNVDTSIPNNISIRSLSLYKTALTDAQCIELTTP